MTARAEDGTVEAYEMPAYPAWFAAVQWHPEDTAATDPAQLALFRSFVTAARPPVPPRTEPGPAPRRVVPTGVARADGELTGPPGAAPAWLAAGLGVLFAAVSAYWGLGGTWLLDTVGGSLAEAGRRRDVGLIAIVWLTVVLKLVAAALGLAVVYHWSPGSRRPYRPRLIRTPAWIAAAILTGYGAVLTSVGLLLQGGVFSIPADADHRALRWHAFLWDPWFLVWGVALATALVRHRGAGPTPTPRG